MACAWDVSGGEDHKLAMRDNDYYFNYYF